MIEWHEVDGRVLDDYPAPVAPSKGPSKYEPIVQALKAGKAVEVEVRDEKQLKGTRIGVARLAASDAYGFKVQFFSWMERGKLGMKRSDMPLSPREEKAPGERKVGRPRKKAGE